MALALQGSLAITETKEPQTGSLWILKLWLGTVVLGFLAGAWYGQWLPRLCQKAWMGVRSKAKMVWTWGSMGWAKLHNRLEAQFTLGDRKGCYYPPQRPWSEDKTEKRKGARPFTSPEKGDGCHGLAESWVAEPSRRRSISPRASAARKKVKEAERAESPRSPESHRERHARRGNTQVVSRMLEAVSPKVPGRGE